VCEKKKVMFEITKQMHKPICYGNVMKVAPGVLIAMLDHVFDFLCFVCCGGGGCQQQSAPLGDGRSTVL
jgi:hypothetical protein